MDLDESLRRLGVDPSKLDTAPAAPVQRARSQSLQRIGLGDGPPKPCTFCGQPARSTGIVDIPERGRCWVDRCSPCIVATRGLMPQRLPATTEGIITDLREVAREAGLTLRVVTDDPLPGVTS